jgi:hypothetical protein
LPLEYAQSYRRAGLSVIPIKVDGSKAPKLSAWDEFKGRRADTQQVSEWFDRDSPPGVAIVGGEVSGGLMVVDFEFLDFFDEWVALVEDQAPGLTAKLPTVRTPGKETIGGRHVYLRSAAAAMPSRKLARMTRAEAKQRAGDPGRTTAVEVKGEGGYVLAPGCPRECHESGRLYEHIAGPPIEEAPTLDEKDVDLMLACARALERGDKASADRKATPAGDAGRPGEDFNRRANWDDVLPAGWTKVRQNGAVTYLCRPGKETGVSATIGYCKTERAGAKLYVFSTNAEPFEDGRSYSKFEAYTMLNHGGDFKAAARQLARQGYGTEATHTNGTAACGQGDSGQAAWQDPDALRYAVGPISVCVAKDREKWRVIVRREEEVLGVAVVNLAEVKGRRELLRSVQGMTEGETKELSRFLLNLAATVEGDWAEHEHRAAERQELEQQEREERTAAEVEAGMREQLQVIESVALDYLSDPALLHRIGEALEHRGLVGERRNGQLLYLCVLSQVTEVPISVVVKGDSSGGKSHLVKTVLEAVPEEAHIDLTSMSEKGLIYDVRPYAHRTVVLFEVHGEGGEFTTYLIRTLISEGQIKHLTVENTTGVPMGREIVKKRPTNFITTTTHPELHTENENRIWTLLVDESPGTTREVMAHQAEMATGKVQEAKMDDLHAVFTWLQVAGAKEAVVPFAEELADALPAKRLRLRRDFPRLLQLIKVCALLHQQQRQRDDQGRVVAELSDYAMIRALVAPIFMRTIAGVTEKTMDLVEALERVLDKKREKRLAGTADYADLVAATGYPKDYISRWLRPALNIGLVDNDTAGERGRAASLTMGKFQVGEDGVLPSASALAEAAGVSVQWVCPVTGREKCGSVANGIATVETSRKSL